MVEVRNRSVGTLAVWAALLALGCSSDAEQEGVAPFAPPTTEMQAISADPAAGPVAGQPGSTTPPQTATPSSSTQDDSMPSAANTDGTEAPQDSPSTTPEQPSTAATADPTGRILPPVDSVDADGPFAVSIDENADNSWVFHPTDLGADGMRHPLFVWGTGAGAVPSQYVDHFSRMASHGFVIIAPTPAQLSSADLAQALDWILAENERMGSPYYQSIDVDRIGMGGHSQGSVATFDLEATEDRLVTTIHIAGGSFDGLGSSKVKTPTAYICGETDFARSNCERDFMNVGDQPTYFSILTGVDHIQCARQALPGMIAWLRWHLAGETERAAQFTGPDGEFFSGIWVSQTANWAF
ncbi:MAG: hypothetical protein OEZ06_12145 [Myxococcales bacterium]|nr:hypothetical protein [Myxococcales bacterium]